MKGKRETRLKIKSRWDQQFFIAQKESEREEQKLPRTIRNETKEKTSSLSVFLKTSTHSR